MTSLLAAVSKREPPHLISVVMPVYNGGATIGAQLDALARQHHPGPWEVVVADNGSTDGTPDLARRWVGRLPGLKVIDASYRRGSAAARNAGVAVSRGDFLAFCEADDEVTETWLAALARAARSSDMVGGYLDEVSLNASEILSIRPPFPRQDQLPVHQDFLPFAVGANCGIWREVLEAVGGWNEAYSWGGGDVELSWRVQLASYSLQFAPDAIVRYRHRSTLVATFRQLFHYGHTHSRLYGEFRNHGVPPAGLRGTIGPWIWLGLHSIDLARELPHRARWLRELAYISGRSWGHVRDRVVG